MKTKEDIQIPIEIYEVIGKHLLPKEYHRWRMSSKRILAPILQTVTFDMLQSIVDYLNQNLGHSIDVTDIVKLDLDYHDDNKFVYLVKMGQYKEAERFLKLPNSKISTKSKYQGLYTLSEFLEEKQGHFYTTLVGYTDLQEFPDINAVLNRVLQFGKPEQALELMERYEVDCSKNNSLAFHKACNYGYLRVVERMLEDPRVDPGSASNSALVRAVQEGHLDVVRRLLQDPRVNPAASSNSSIYSAIQTQNEEIALLLYQDPRVDPFGVDHRSFLVAIENGMAKLVKLMLEDPRCIPAFIEPKHILAAAQKGNYEVIQLIWNSPIVNISTDSLLAEACKAGLIDFVKILLADPRFDPSQSDNLPFRNSVIYRNFDIIPLLLADPRFNYKVGTADMVRQVASKKRPDIMRILIGKLILEPEDSISRFIFYKCTLGECDSIQALFSPNGDILTNQQALIRASEVGMVDTVSMLLDLDDPTIVDKNQTALLKACQLGHYNVIQRLLKDSRIDPSMFGCLSLTTAARNGHFSVVKLLLQDYQVSPSASNDKALRVAAENGHIEIVRFLLADPRSDPSAMYNEAIRSAIRNKDKKMIECLKSDPRVRES